MNKRGMMLAILATLSMPLLSGCEKKVLAVAVKPPASLLTCAGEPLAPVLPPPGIERDRIVTDWLLAMRAAWGSCSSQLAGVKHWADALPD
jgi:hypothetical protein